MTSERNYVSVEEKNHAAAFVGLSRRKAIDEYFRSIAAVCDAKAVELLCCKINDHVQNCYKNVVNSAKSGEIAGLSDVEWKLWITERKEYVEFFNDALQDIKTVYKKHIDNRSLTAENLMCSSYCRELENAKLLAVLLTLGETLSAIRTVKDKEDAERYASNVDGFDEDLNKDNAGSAVHKESGIHRLK
jgi:hypothetical protein